MIHQVVKVVGPESQKLQQGMFLSQAFSNCSDNISLRSKEMKCYEQEYLSASLVLIYSLWLIGMNLVFIYDLIDIFEV